MSDIWFHATPDGGRLGPMRAEDLCRLFQTGGVQATTPVWREGMADWVPLSSVASQLGLPAMPPPLPLPLPGVPPPPPRRGMHWIWIVLILLGGLAVPVFAVLAAVAIPAYNDYRLRAGLAEIIAASAPVRGAVQVAAADSGMCPVVTGSAGRAAFSTPDVDTAVAGLLGNPHVADVLTLHRSAFDQCEVLVKLKDFRFAEIDGEVLNWSLEPDTGDWHCGSSVPHRFLPESCRRAPGLADDIPQLQTGISGR